MKIVISVLAMALLMTAACGDESGPPCRGAPNDYRTEALAKRLTKNGVRFSLHKDRGICYSAKDEAAVDRASREVDSYFFEVAGLFRDSCEEKAFTEWAEREKLPFRVHDTRGSDGQPAGRLFNIYSITPEDVELNRKKLRETAPKDATCPKSIPK